MESLNTKEQILTDKERDEILHDLFLGKEGELNSSFLYKGKGAELYEEISKDKGYPFIDIENEALENFRYNNKFLKILNNTKYITDVGSGDGQKIVSLLGRGGPYKDRSPVAWKGTYIPEDYSRQMLDIAEKKVREELPHVKLGSSQKLNNGRHLSQQCQNNMYLFLGGTICNMSDEDIITELTNMDNNGIISGNKILLSYFTAPNTQEEIDDLIKIYNSESNKAFHENGIDMLGLSKDDFEYDTVYEKDNPDQKKGPFPGRIKGIIRAKKDTVVNLSNGNKIYVEKGKEFTLHYSRRFSKKGIEKLFEKSGCSVVFTVDNTGDAITLLQRKPRRMGTIKKIANKALISALIVGSLVGYGIKSKQAEKANEKDKAYTEREAKTKAKTNNEGIYYYQETNELISALQLDDLDNKVNKQTIIDLFNIYVGNHKTEGMSNEELIQGFWEEYGGILVKDFGITNSPYNFMTSELIDLTNNINEELTYAPQKSFNNKLFSQRHYLDYGVFESIENDRPFEYKDGGKVYLISKVKINVGENEKWVYFAGKQSNQGVYSEFSTNIINEIQDKTGLDNEIISNTVNLKDNYTITSNIFNHHPLHIQNTNGDQIVKMSMLGETNVAYNTLYLRGKLYYIITVPTGSGKSIGLASESPDGLFTTTTFNTISKDFRYAWHLS